ncbi:hypothetical protein TrST_g7636 [Triparma strigata]|uniref:Xylose isomerase-like TIM barrel domain-containing protein n=1 Tax=Triparma strigata TaxID=1606541 RepID=A0A9W7AS19_9STRA|nr:hypothetical protein TrST_g7636 [Triparma strigata]
MSIYSLQFNQHSTNTPGRPPERTSSYHNCPLSDILVDTLESCDVTPKILSPPSSKLPGLGLVFPQKTDVSAIVLSNSNVDFPPSTPSVLKSTLSSCSVLLLQSEIPWSINALALSLSPKTCIKILDLGGSFTPLPPTLALTFLTMNESESVRLLKSLNSPPLPPLESSALILKSFPNIEYVIITYSSSSVILSSRSRSLKIRPPKINYMDGTGSGDCFRAALSGKLYVNGWGTDWEDVKKAVEYAVEVASKSCESLGAQRLKVIGRGGGQGSEAEELGFGSRLNSMKDMQPKGFRNDLESWIKRQTEIKGLTCIDFNYPQHINPETDLEEVKGWMGKLKTGAVCLRYPKKFVGGAFTNVEERLRREAIELTKEACETALKLNCNEVVVWSAYDGYDYTCTTDYNERYDNIVEAFREICEAYPDVKVSLEFKPTDENTRFFTIPTTGMALLLTRDVGLDNFGLTLDFGHMIMAGENPGQSVAAVLRENKLFGVQLNDGYSRYAAEDGLEFGSVNPKMALEVIFWLRKGGFKGHFYFDTFPLKLDPVKEAERNIETVKKLWKMCEELEGESGLESVWGDWEKCKEKIDKVMFR